MKRKEVGRKETKLHYTLEYLVVSTPNLTYGCSETIIQVPGYFIRCLYKLGNILHPDAGFTLPYYFLSFLDLFLLCRGTPYHSQSFCSSNLGILPPLKGQPEVSVFFRVGRTFPAWPRDPTPLLNPRTF
jgi:hypothetical protein